MAREKLYTGNGTRTIRFPDDYSIMEPRRNYGVTVGKNGGPKYLCRDTGR